MNYKDFRSKKDSQSHTIENIGLDTINVKRIKRNE